MHNIALLRAAVLALLFASLGAISVVFVLYARAYSLLAPDVRVRRAGLTPLQVALVSAGVVIIQAGLAWALMVNFSAELEWDGAVRTGMYGLGTGLILASMAVMGRLQTRRKVQFGRAATVTVQRIDTTTTTTKTPEEGQE